VYFNNPTELIGYEDNFGEWIKIDIKSGDLTSKSHFENKDVRTTHKSRIIQNQLIPIIGDSTYRYTINNFIKCENSSFFSVLFDEKTDVSHISKLVIEL